MERLQNDYNGGLCRLIGQDSLVFTGVVMAGYCYSASYKVVTEAATPVLGRAEKMAVLDHCDFGNKPVWCQTVNCPALNRVRAAFNSTDQSSAIPTPGKLNVATHRGALSSAL